MTRGRRTPIPIKYLRRVYAASLPVWRPRRSRALVAEHLNNPAEYAPGADSKYRLPSASKRERDYSPRRYWCGPVWINMNWLIADGLRRYGFGPQLEPRT